MVLIFLVGRVTVAVGSLAAKSQRPTFDASHVKGPVYLGTAHDVVACNVNFTLDLCEQDLSARIRGLDLGLLGESERRDW